MANNKILGGSPLGLIGVRSWYGSDGLSTFNAGKTRNTDVDAYNKRSSSTKSKSGGNLYGNSLFSGNRIVRAWPNVKDDDSRGLGDVRYNDSKDKDGKVTPKGDNSTRRVLHNNDVYDTSILNIIEKLAPTKAALRPADFAYLKNVGVYPNNRLMIARRFASPCDDNIMVKKGPSDLGPFAVLISWVPENENFLSFTFGEEWVESDADFTGILNSLGEDIGLGNLGGISGAGGNILPLPGFTEIFQRNFLKELGLIEKDSANTIPAGNPNLIKQSKRRKVVGYTEAGSGLKTTINIKMVCEYELKYISGIDPTVVWMDLLGMITRFGTSNSETYGLSKDVGAKLTRWVNNPNQLIEETAAAIGRAVTKIIEEITKAITDVYNKATAAAQSLSSVVNDDDGTSGSSGKPKPVSDQKAALDAAGAEKKESESLRDQIATTLNEAVKKGLSGLLQKYRVKIVGIINSLTGLPSTPWHLTIGNPMRPTFCSGDMYVDNVELRLGPTLAFNDLPSSITVEFNLQNARPLGMQEIMGKFNSGYLRTVDAQKSFYETNQVVGVDGKSYPEKIGVLPFNDEVYGSAGSSGTSGNSGTAGAGQSGVNPTNSQGGTSAPVTTDQATGGTVSVTTDANNANRANNGQLAQNLPMSTDASQPAYQTTTA